METKRILIIADKATLLEILQLCLAKLENWQVLTADSMPNGFTIAQSEQPDLIVLDLSEPKIDGISFLKIRLNCSLIRFIPLIALSLKSRLLSPGILPTLGVDYTITKPFDQKSFVHQISHVLDKSPARD